MAVYKDGVLHEFGSADENLEPISTYSIGDSGGGVSFTDIWDLLGRSASLEGTGLKRRDPAAGEAGPGLLELISGGALNPHSRANPLGKWGAVGFPGGGIFPLRLARAPISPEGMAARESFLGYTTDRRWLNERNGMAVSGRDGGSAETASGGPAVTLGEAFAQAGYESGGLGWLTLSDSATPGDSSLGAIPASMSLDPDSGSWTLDVHAGEVPGLADGRWFGFLTLPVGGKLATWPYAIAVAYESGASYPARVLLRAYEDLSAGELAGALDYSKFAHESRVDLDEMGGTAHYMLAVIEDEDGNRMASPAGSLAVSGMYEGRDQLELYIASLSGGAPPPATAGPPEGEQAPAGSEAPSCKICEDPAADGVPAALASLPDVAFIRYVLPYGNNSELASYYLAATHAGYPDNGCGYATGWVRKAQYTRYEINLWIPTNSFGFSIQDTQKYLRVLYMNPETGLCNYADITLGNSITKMQSVTLELAGVWPTSMKILSCRDYADGNYSPTWQNIPFGFEQTCVFAGRDYDKLHRYFLALDKETEITTLAAATLYLETRDRDWSVGDDNLTGYA